jgi:hypothetical protein
MRSRMTRRHRHCVQARRLFFTYTMATIQPSFANAAKFFNSLLSCSLSRGSAQFFTPPPRTAPIVGAHSRRQDPKTPVEQALMRGLGTA